MTIAPPQGPRPGGQWDYIKALRQRYFGLWQALSPEQQKRYLDIAKASAQGHENVLQFMKRISQLKSFQKWQDNGEVPTDPDPEDPEDPDDPGNPDPNDNDDDDVITPPAPPGAPVIDQNILDILSQFLSDNQLPSTLLGFIQDGLASKKSYSQIIAELRQTPEYKAAYPENDIRMANGLDWIPESQIRGLRSEFRRLASEYLGVSDVSQDELNNVIGKGWSLSTWEKKLQRFQEFERWGPTVKAVLESQLGYSLDDERLYAFFDDTPTPELDHAYETALMRAQPALLGLGVRPEEEAEILRRYGIAPEQAFSGYQSLARELPRSQRLGMIDSEIKRNIDKFPTGTELFADTPFATLFRAIQLQDQDAISQLQSQMATEVARFQGQGGVAQNQEGASVGLLDPDEQ